MRIKRCALMVGAIGLMAATTIGAQTIRGRAIDSLNHGGLSGVLVELHDVSGKLLSHTFTSPSGGFVLQAAPGTRYQLQFAAIGYVRHSPVALTTADGELVVPDVQLSLLAVTLPELRSLAGKRACGKSEINEETFGGLLSSAHTALQVMDATLQAREMGFQMQLVHSISVKRAHDSSVSADTSATTVHAWPVRSLSVDSLKQIGFQRAMTADEGSGHVYYGPDMQVMFSDWFLENHCFTLDKNLTRGDTVVIRYEPTGKPKHVDLSGELVLDSRTLTLQRLTYEHRNLPNGFPDHSAGGDIRFGEKAPGLWVPTDWAIWIPVVKVQRAISRPTPVYIGGGGRRGSVPQSMGTSTIVTPALVQVVGRDELRGHLLRIVPTGG